MFPGLCIHLDPWNRLSPGLPVCTFITLWFFFHTEVQTCKSHRVAHRSKLFADSPLPCGQTYITLWDLSRLLYLKVVLPLLGMSHLSSLAYFFPLHWPSSEILHILLGFIFCLPFKWKLHNGRDFCVVLTVESRTELAHRKCSINIHWMNKWRVYRIFPTWLCLWIQNTLLAHTLLPWPHPHSPILYVPTTDLLVVPETLLVTHTCKPFSGQGISSVWNSNTCSPTIYARTWQNLTDLKNKK